MHNKRLVWAIRFWWNFFGPSNSLNGIHLAGIRFQTRRVAVGCADFHKALFTTSIRMTSWLWQWRICTVALHIGKAE
jgi:hypothetical protein